MLRKLKNVIGGYPSSRQAKDEEDKDDNMKQSDKSSSRRSSEPDRDSAGSVSTSSSSSSSAPDRVEEKEPQGKFFYQVFTILNFLLRQLIFLNKFTIILVCFFIQFLNKQKSCIH